MTSAGNPSAVTALRTPWSERLVVALLGLLTAFHVWLLAAHAASGRLFEPAVAVRWLAGLLLVAGFLGLRRLGIPLVRGRKAAVLWTLVVLLHWHAAISKPAADEPPGFPTAAVIVAPVTIASAALAVGLLVWLVARRPAAADQRPSRWSTVTTAAAGVATPARVPALAPRPPPLC